jgi:hypothetical protein
MACIFADLTKTQRSSGDEDVVTDINKFNHLDRIQSKETFFAIYKPIK